MIPHHNATPSSSARWFAFSLEKAYCTSKAHLRSLQTMRPIQEAWKIFCTLSNNVPRTRSIGIIRTADCAAGSTLHWNSSNRYLRLASAFIAGRRGRIAGWKAQQEGCGILSRQGLGRRVKVVEAISRSRPCTRLRGEIGHLLLSNQSCYQRKRSRDGSWGFGGARA